MPLHVIGSSFEGEGKEKKVLSPYLLREKIKNRGRQQALIVRVPRFQGWQITMRQTLPLMMPEINKEEKKKAGSSKLPVGDVHGRENFYGWSAKYKCSRKVRLGAKATYAVCLRVKHWGSTFC